LNSLFQQGGQGQGQGQGQRQGASQGQGQGNNNSNISNADGSRRNRRSRRNVANDQNNNIQQQQQDQYQQNNYNHDNYNFMESGWDDDGIYAHDQGGMLIIDDDYNPGLRSGFQHSTNHSQHQNQNQNQGQNSQQQQRRQQAPTTWAPDDLRTRYGYASRNRADMFPALSTPASTSTSTPASAANSTQTQPQPQSQSASKPKAKPKPSKSLSRIGNLVQKTNPKQVEKQRKARATALRQAEIANMPFEEVMRRMEMGDDFQPHGASGLLPVPPIDDNEGSGNGFVTEGQLERNRNFASALGVAPSTMRTQLKLNAGWARPTSIPKQMDEFGNELNATQYPDELILEARERMTELLRLETKWKKFLQDDKAASCPLKAMERPLRKFVHGYSDYWNLRTESFDPEPKRYIHCVKLLETRSPRPLLSQAVRMWRGPAPSASARFLSDNNMGSGGGGGGDGQPAGEDTASSSAREFPSGEEREPLKIAPRTIPSGIVAPPGAMFDMDIMMDVSQPLPAVVPGTAIALAASSANSNVNGNGNGPASASQEAAPRFAPMLAERETTRPKLNLGPRTKPLALPKYQPPPSTRMTMEDMAQNGSHTRRRMMTEKQRAETVKKKNILATAFASDDEEDSSSESEWEVEKEDYSSESDEGEC